MKKSPLLTVFVILGFLMAGLIPLRASANTPETNSLAATTATLTITNPLPKMVDVTITGAKDYSFSIPAGQEKIKTIEKGKYRFKYKGCLNKTFSGILPYKDGKYVLDIAPCKMINLRIINPFLDDYASEMKGWMNYQINVPARTIKSFSIVAGRYLLNYTCDGKSWSGRVRLNKDATWFMCDS